MTVEVAEVAPGVFQAQGKHVSWVLVTDGDDVTLVDAGYPGDRDRVLASLDHIGRRPADVSAVVLTHAHPDHIGSAEFLRSQHGVPVSVHADEAAHARGEVIEQVGIPTLLRQIWRPDVLFWVADIVQLRAARAERIAEVGTFDSGPLAVPGGLVAVATPGHTSGHVAFHLPERGALLAGDALMTEHALVGDPGPQLLPEFFHHDVNQALGSLDRIADLDAEVVVPGHGEAFFGTPAAAVAAARSRAGVTASGSVPGTQ